MTTRRCRELEDSDVKQFYEWGGLLVLFLLRFDRSGRLYCRFSDYIQDRFSRKVAGYAVKNHAKGVILYDTSALQGFRRLECFPDIIRIQDVSIAARNYTAGICRREAQKDTPFAAAYRKYTSFDNPKKMRLCAEEIEKTDHFLVPSSFVRKSLEFNGVPASRIHIVPYGVDTAQFIPYERVRREGEPVKFLFVGNIEPRKGIGYLLEAFRQLDASGAQLYIAGAFKGDPGEYDAYRPWFKYLGYLPTTQIQEVYRQSDVFVFPSLWEGFSLVVPEAMACGLPVICSDHAGSSDIIEEGVEGFVIPAGDLEALKEKILFFTEHPEQIAGMGRNARKKAEQYSWERYEQRVTEVMRAIVKEEKG
jgi:glycosyltransferase involved in cell wall biosynthesis